MSSIFLKKDGELWARMQNSSAAPVKLQLGKDVLVAWYGQGVYAAFVKLQYSFGGV